MLAEVLVQPLDARLDDLLFVVHREGDVDRRDLRSVRTGLMGMSGVLTAFRGGGVGSHGPDPALRPSEPPVTWLGSL